MTEPKDCLQATWFLDWEPAAMWRFLPISLPPDSILAI